MIERKRSVCVGMIKRERSVCVEITKRFGNVACDIKVTHTFVFMTATVILCQRISVTRFRLQWCKNGSLYPL